MSDKFISPCPQPTPFEAEVYDQLIEECCEVGQRTTKILRFGIMEIQPQQPLNNRDRLSLEVGDLLAMVILSRKYGLINWDVVKAQIPKKTRNFYHYLQNDPPH